MQLRHAPTLLSSPADDPGNTDGEDKRWHDHDKSGWWFLLSFVPYLGGLVSFVICGCLRGTRGPNRYGPDPV